MNKKNELNDLQQFCNNLQILESFLNSKDDFSEYMNTLISIIKKTVPISEMVLLRMKENENIKQVLLWHEENTKQIVDEEKIDSHGDSIMDIFIQRKELSSQELETIFYTENQEIIKNFKMFFIGDKKVLNGIIFVAKNKADGAWLTPEEEYLSALSMVLNISFLNKSYQEENHTKEVILTAMLNVMDVNTYVTDIETDEILYMNETMKKAFSLENPEHQICWKVLQKGMTERCGFCPIALLKNKEDKIGESQSYVWEENNTITKRVYRNYDNLVYWVDGRVAHIQQSIDITESKKLTRAATMDELTEMLNRRAGKMELEKDLFTCRMHGKPIIVCMYDINDLKVVNDKYGHKEGDTLLSTVSKSVRQCLGEKDYSFRLSGDEFIIVFRNTKKYAIDRMKKIKQELIAINQQDQKTYTIDFCYGLLEIPPYSNEAIQDVLTSVDEMMYEQKRIFHLKKKHLELQKNGHQSTEVDFIYDKDKLYDALVQSTDSYIYVSNIKTGVFRYPKAMVEEFDLPGEVVENAAQVWGDKVHPHDKKAFLESNQEIADGRTDFHNVEYRAKNRYGEWVWMRCRGHVEYDENGEAVLFAGMISNLGRKKKIDHISGLLNKHEFEQVIRDLILLRSDYTVGVMIVALDGLKLINDLYDREFGDEVIRIITQKIVTLLPENASIYRLDGNEFGIVASDTTKEDMKVLYSTLQQVFSRQQQFNNKKFYSTFSAGCVLYPNDAITFEELYRYAKYSLEWAKENGKNRILFYNEEIINNKYYQLELTELLRASIENDFEGFSLHYQMQVDAKTQVVIGAEALARFEHNGKSISPLTFIPILENNNLIQVVGKWIFKTAIATCAEWIKIHYDFKMSVNLSYLQLLDTTFISFIKDTLQQFEVDPNNIIIELTESTFISNFDILKESFSKIRELGIEVAMDDFGTGYSSLGILKEAPIDIVKIDKMFVKDIVSSKFNATFIKCIVELCHTINIKVCLEGIETKEEYGIAYPMGIDIIQGFFFGKPQPKTTFERQNLLLEKISEIQQYTK